MEEDKHLTNDECFIQTEIIKKDSKNNNDFSDLDNCTVGQSGSSGQPGSSPF